MKEIQLTLTIEETNLILSKLGDAPYSKVAALIVKLQDQAEESLDPKP